MADFGGIVYLTEDQYTTLRTNGTLTVEDVTVTFDENTLYVTPQTGSGEGGGTAVTVGNVAVETLSFDSDPQEQLNNHENRLSVVEETLTDITPDVSRALKVPMSAPSTTKLVAVDTTNGQAMITIGEGLLIENDTLKSTINSSDFVTIDTDQAITGPKRFRGNLKISAMDIDLDTNPTSTQWRYIDFVDKDGARLGVVGAQFGSNGQAGMYMQSRNNGSIGVKVGATGDPYAWAPSTDILSNSNEIATSDFVKSTTMGTISNRKIQANTNLNSTAYLEIGTYICDGNTTAVSLTNCPTDLGFIMHVLSPLGDTKTPGTDTYVYRIRRITTYSGLEFIQSVEAGSNASVSYGDWKFIKHGNQYTDGYKAIWENKTAGDQSATITLDYRVPRGLLFVGKTSAGPYQHTYMPFGFCKNRTVYLYHANRDAYLGGNLTTSVSGALGTLGCKITVTLDVTIQGNWSSGTQSAYFVY